MNDQIIIRGLTLTSHIGVPAEERATTQTLRAHLTLEVSTFPQVDDIEGTVDYKAVSDDIRQLASTGERKLIETLAQDIATLILKKYPVLNARVEIEKFILPETDWVGVVINRTSLKRN